MPTLRLITSSSQLRLLEAFADKIRSSPLPPLEKEKIVILSNGMARWISMELALRLGVSAGLDFSFPNDLLDRSFKSILPGERSSFHFTQDSLAWRIAARLPGLLDQDNFREVARYLGDASDTRRLLQISRSLANCFDQYTIFRPEMVLAWDDGAGDDWQAQLWRSLNIDSKGTHRAALLRELQRHVANGAAPEKPLPRRITLFGISYLPPFHLEALRLLSTYSDVTCYLLNPCGQYWGTIVSAKKKSRMELQPALSAEAEEYYETGNRLLSSLGTLGQEFFETLLEFGFDAEELDNTPQITTQPHDNAPNRTLATIQSDILTLYDRPADACKSVIAASDRSVQIHSCHGMLREMEILYDNLLGLFDELPDLEPRHILVMIPEIEAYTPYISSVFGSRSSARPQLPFTIADRSIRRESAFIEAFLKITGVGASRFTLHEMLDLLENSVVSGRFDLGEDELLNIREWLQACNVRWGVDAGHRADLGFPLYDDFSWQAGLDRLFLGYAMAPDGSSTFGGILPYPACSGLDAETLGKLADFFSVIKETSIRLRERHTLPEWADILSVAAERMLMPDAGDLAGSAAVANALNSLREACTLYGFNQPLAIDALRDHLVDALAGSGGGYGFMGGAITFCAMLPMRSVPMRVVWLAGMNDGQFPRTERPPGFSLMNGARRRGDRSLRDEDRYLFLEALMAAKERFCISYNGQSDRDNSTIPPSVLVAELIDYIAGGFVEPDNITPATVVVRHRLQGFSPAYFNGGDMPALFSYDRETCQAIEARRISALFQHRIITAPLPEESCQPLQIDLHQLKNFLSNPAAAFLKERLRVRPFNPADEPDEAEPFALDALSRYNLSQELVNQILNGGDYDACLSAARSRGILPPLLAGKAAFDSVWVKSRTFAAALEPQLGIPLAPLPVTFDGNGVRLVAVLENIRSGTHIRWRSATLKGKDRLTLWLEHLLLNIARADGYPASSKMISSGIELELSPLENAAAILSDLLDLYREGMTRPLPFFPSTSWTFLREGEAKAETVWRGDHRRNLYGECEDQAAMLCFGGEVPWGEEFLALANRIYAPLAAASLRGEDCRIMRG